MIIQRVKTTQSFNDSMTVEAKIHGYSVTLSLKADGEIEHLHSRTLSIVWILRDAGLSDNALFDCINDLKDGESKIVKLNDKLEKEIRDYLFNYSLDTKILSAESDIYSFVLGSLQRFMSRNEFISWCNQDRNASV